jgi:plasmid stabilization system protein ParE
MRSLQGRTSLAARATVAAVARSYDAEEAPEPRQQMGDEVPSVIRGDAEFRRLFRESQTLRGSRRPNDQEKLKTLLGDMRARWAELTGEYDGN